MTLSQTLIRFAACLLLLGSIRHMVDWKGQTLVTFRRTWTTNSVAGLRSRPPSADYETTTTSTKTHQEQAPPQIVITPSSLQEDNIQESESPSTSTLHVLLYETESLKDSQAQSLLNQLSQLKGIKATIFGENTGFEGYGSKYSAVYPLLKEMDADSLVVISDSRDVLINNPAHTDAYQSTAVEEFRLHFEEFTCRHPGAIVISAEAQCCVSALTYVEPGDYYNADGSRNQHSCASGEPDCTWVADEKALPWEDFMRNLAVQHTTAKDTKYDDVYLNAGLIAGKAQDLLRVIEQAAIGKDEDDQAVLTDFMYLNPDAIILDYGQKLFGNNRGGLGGMDDGSCVFGLPEGDAPAGGRLVHSKTLSSPLFLHSPGGFFECQDDLAVKLGLKDSSSIVHRRLKEGNSSKSGKGSSSSKSGCNYGGGNYRNGCLDDREDDRQLLDGVHGGLDWNLSFLKGGASEVTFWTRSAD